MTQEILSKRGHDGIPLACESQSLLEGYPFLNLLAINEVNNSSAIPIEGFLENTKKTMAKAKYKRIQSFEHFNVAKKAPVVLVGGGPSLNDSILVNDLKRHYASHVTISCGSSHNWMCRNGMPPNICVICDPDPISANYLTLNSDFTTYFVASSCDESVFEVLKDRKVYIFHLWSSEPGYQDKLAEIDPHFKFAIGGGCTVGLRTISIALMMGFNKIHFFGFDSCLGKNDSRYSYPLSSDTERMGRIYTIRLGLGALSEKTFRCEAYHLAQASHFKSFYEDYNKYFTPVFHGDGLLKEIVDIAHKEANITLGVSE